MPINLLPSQIVRFLLVATLALYSSLFMQSFNTYSLLRHLTFKRHSSVVTHCQKWVFPRRYIWLQDSCTVYSCSPVFAMSGEFILTQLREEFSKRCLIVRGIPPGTDPQFVNSIFKGQCRHIQHKEGTMWLILFHNPQRKFFPLTM